MRLFTGGALAILLLIAPAQSHAGTIVAEDFVGVAVGYFSPFDPVEARAVLGSVRMSDGTGISPAIDGRVFEAYCVDINGAFEIGIDGSETFDATASSMTLWDLYGGPVHAAAAGRKTAWLFNEYAEDIAAADDDLGRTSLLMAIWNVLYDDDFTVTGGDFYVSDSTPTDLAVRARADTYLNALLLNLPAAAVADATWLQLEDCSGATCTDVQDFVGPLAVAPEPSLALLLLAGGLFTASRRQRRRGRQR